MRISDWSSDVCSSDLPGWIVASCYITIACGTMFGGWRIVKTMGQKITKLKPVGGFCAEIGGASTLFFASAFGIPVRSEEHTSELQSLMRISYAVFCLKKKKHKHTAPTIYNNM